MSFKIKIEEKIDQVDVTSDVAVVMGSRTPTVLAWYKVAKENLSSAEILLQSKRTPHAIFSFSGVSNVLLKVHL